jgi:hypothetical protein
VKTALADHQSRTVQLDLDRLRRLEAAVEDLSHYVAVQGSGLAAILSVVHAKGWVPKSLVTAMKERGWLTDKGGNLWPGIP